MITTRKKGEWFEITVPKTWHGLTIEDVFNTVWNASKKETHRLRMEKSVLLNNRPANWITPLDTGDRLQLRLFSDVDFGVTPFYFNLQLLYEDDHLLIVNKPAGMDTHPNSLEQTDTLANGVAYYLMGKGEQRRIKHIHRLDRNTSGAILFAKHSFIGSILDKMLQERKIKRTYIAIVHGIIKNDKGTINAPIGRDRHHPTRRRVSQNGQNAVTHYNVIKRDTEKKLTVVKCQLDTGRTHQIRVHFSYIGHPLAGDVLYGGKEIYHRQALHSYKLELVHPFTQERISVKSTCNLTDFIG